MTGSHIRKTVGVYDQIAERYAGEIERYVPYTERDKFVSLFPQKARVLDVGSAAGRDSIYFLRHRFDVVGVDLSNKLLAIAQEKAPNIDFQKQDVRSLHFPNSSFDGIWACAVLLHLKRDEVPSVLKKFYSLLKPWGHLFIMVKQGQGEADVVDKLSPDTARHFTYFTEQEVQKLLSDAGFAVDEIYSWNEKDRYPERRDVWWISSFSTKK